MKKMFCNFFSKVTEKSNKTGMHDRLKHVMTNESTISNIFQIKYSLVHPSIFHRLQQSSLTISSPHGTTSKLY